ncbi:LTA synthase family protein [Heyndrickxia oleronia]|uniref:LTA synthase family protein n=1 Tax=Heyndrickxia oleronia TaxID=38875 RepID=UPI0033363B09
MNKIWAFIKEHLAFIIFLMLITLKLHLFSKNTNTTFLLDNLGYFKNGFSVLFKQGSFEAFYTGLFLVSFGALLLLSFWTLFMSGRKQLIALFILNLVISFIAIADIIYYRYFHDILSIPVLSQANQTGAVSGSIKDLFQWKDLVFFIDLIILIPIIIFLYIRKIKWKKQIGFRGKAATSVLVAVIGFIFVYAPTQDYISKYGNVLFKQNWYNMSLFNKTGLIGFHAYDAYKFVDETFIHKTVISKEDKKKAQDWFKEHQKTLAANSPYDGIAKGKNIIMIQLEAFNNFFINQKVNGQEITPNINKLIKDSMYYKNFYHEAAQGRTSDAEFLTNESMYPLTSGSVYVRYGNQKFDGLATNLSKAGYTTAAFHAYEKSFWNRYVMYQNNGMQHFFGKDDFKPGEIAGWALGDRPFFQQAIDKMKTFDQPFYSFMISLTSHHPYEIQSQYKELNLEGYSGIFANYLQSVHYTDKAIGEMVERLKKEGLWDKSVLIMYGDHDYGVKEDANMTKIAGVENTPLNVERLYNQVPLIIHLPNDAGKGIYEKAAGQLDIAPTIFHLLGMKPNNLYMMGSNIVSKEDNLVVFRYGSFTDGKVYYKASQDGVFNNGICYDLKTEQETDVQQCKAGYDESRERLTISDHMIMGNLVTEFEGKQK